jgi:hypothetical protein
MNLTLLAGIAVLTGHLAQPAIDNQTKSQTVDALVKAMNDEYYFPDIAKQVESALKAKLSSGAYGGITEGPAFAKALTDDMNALCHDAHLRVRFSDDLLPQRKDRDLPSAQEIEQGKHFEKVMNSGFMKVERMAGNVGYIELVEFGDPDLAAGPIRAAMDFVSNTDALVFDIRKNGGGDPATVRLLCSYLFDAEPVHLNDIYGDKGKAKKEFWTLKSVPGNRYVGKDIYILTSLHTGSGAEEFAYDLQNLHRATIIGESTWGGANPGHLARLNDHFNAFIPVGRAMNPYSKTNWEGTGVQPDLKVKQEDALREAHHLALTKLLEKASSDDERQRLQRAIDSIKS